MAAVVFFFYLFYGILFVPGGRVLRGGGDEWVFMLWYCTMPRRILYVGGRGVDGHEAAAWETCCQQCTGEGTVMMRCVRRCMVVDGKERKVMSSKQATSTLEQDRNQMSARC